ncbi:hypothetical protein [Limnohabitans sp.]|uniref:hypothetical protein n=1 Tax=Limnohabitans sp. TaxID=1907725 RepID=UPI00286ED29E|nr:hypothetical protein [Limnohabitans sp.]
MKIRCCKRMVIGWAALVLLHVSAIAQTGDRVGAPVKGVTALSVYAKPYDAQMQDKLPVQNISFPAPVLEASGDFLKIRVAGKTLWIDGAEVSIEKPVDYVCAKSSNSKPSKVAAMQGASTGCN